MGTDDSLILLGMRHRCRRLRLEALQQEGGVHDKGHADREQRVNEDVELGLAEAVLAQPVEDGGLGLEIAAVNAGEPFAEVDQCRQLRHAPFACVPRIGHLHERYVQILRFAVDILQHDQRPLTFQIVPFVCLGIEGGIDGGLYTIWL